MSHRRHLAVAAFVGLLLLLLALSWVCGRGEPASRSLRFKPGDGSTRPLFVLMTRGQLETNNNRAVYIYPPYYERADRVGPISALNYSVRNGVRSGLYRLGFRGRIDRLGAGVTSMGPNSYPAMLRFGFRDPRTNEVFYQDAYLKSYLESDGGFRLPLRLGSREMMVTGRPVPEYVDTYFLPSPLTNRGTYRLVAPSNETRVTFVY